MLGVIQEAIIADRRAQQMATSAQVPFIEPGEPIVDARVELEERLEVSEDSEMLGGRDLGQYQMTMRRLNDIGGELGT